MFFLAEIQENIRLTPGKLRHDFLDAITDALNQKYCNKVVVDLGLCISVFDVLEAEDPYVHPGDPNAFVKCRFRLIVLRPFEGEVIVGKIRSCDEDGVHVALEFFDDVIIPANCLQQGTFLYRVSLICFKLIYLAIRQKTCMYGGTATMICTWT